MYVGRLAKFVRDFKAGHHPYRWRIPVEQSSLMEPGKYGATGVLDRGLLLVCHLLTEATWRAYHELS